MNRLAGKVAIVTGGATGIGEAIAKKFAREGASVLVNGFPEDPVNEVVKEIQQEGGQAAAFASDVSVDENALRCVEFAIHTYGKLDILINNAGVFPVMEEIHNYPSDAFDYLVKNNIRTAFLMTKYAVPELRKTKGCIVSAGSEAGEKGLPENASFGGTKGWMHAFTRGVVVEQEKYRVRANSFCLGPIDTALKQRD